MSPFASRTGEKQSVSHLIVDAPLHAPVHTPRAGKAVVAAGGNSSAGDTSIPALRLDIPGAGDEDDDKHRVLTPLAAAEVVIKDAGGRVAPRADSPASGASARKAILLSAADFDGLKHLDGRRISNIFTAKTADAAKASVGLLNRFLDWLLPKLNKPRASSVEAATRLFHAVQKNGHDAIGAFQTLREMVRPEERHHFKLNVLEHKDTGEREIRMTAGGLELFRSRKLPPDSPALPSIEGARRIAAASNILGGLNPPVDADEELRHIRATGDFRAFQALRARLAPADQALAKVTETSDGELWYYTLKIGETDIFDSRPLLDDTLTDAEKAQLTGPGPLDGAQTEALHHKLENALLAAKVSVLLSNRPRADDDIPDMEELEATERALVAALDGKTTIWDKYAAISAFVIAQTDPGKCYCRIIPVELTAEADAAYTLHVDGKLVHTAIAGDEREHVAAATNRVAMSAMRAARSISAFHTVDNFRKTNIQCMSDDPEVQDFIGRNLRNQTYSSDRLLRIVQPLDANGDETAEFSAVFRSDDDGGETSITFSNRLSSRNEFRSALLKDALAGKSGSFGDLADLTAQGYMTPADSALVYAMTPVSGDIDADVGRLEDLGIDMSPGSEFRQSIAAIKVTDKLTLGQVIPSAGRDPDKDA